MKSMGREFKDFINKGNVVTTAVGLVLGLYFKTIIDKIIEGVINPILAAIVGESSLASWGFDIGDARISIGMVLDAIITFVIVAFILFLVVKAYNSFQRKEEEAGELPPSEVDLLTEIRDELRNRSS